MSGDGLGLLVVCPVCGRNVLIKLNKPLFPDMWPVYCLCGYSFMRDLMYVVNGDSKNNERAQKRYGRIF